ncbi:MAG: glycosyltransferase family 4 protein, partial [Candidatus Diapherotrites archaeon]|nr:glycosyltransferase family 4 protein [Candidatus Diapherotrites archaeon]
HLGINKDVFFPKNKNECRKKTGFSEKEKIILNVGSEEKRKNIESLINAFELISKENENAIFVRVGEKTKKIQKAIKEKKLEQKVIYFSKISLEMLSNIYNSADLFIFPSVLEGFGFGPLEAMSCGTPVLSSRKTSLKEIVPKEIEIINPIDEKEISEKALEIITDSKKALKNSEKGIEWSRKFTWQKCAEKTKKVYEEIK